MPALRFTRLHLENWRNFRTVDVDLQTRVFLVGPNASGKSNFLDAIRFLRDLTPGGGLQTAIVGRRGGLSAVRCLAARQRPAVTVHVTIGNDEEPAVWDYHLVVNQSGKQKAPTIEAERVMHHGKLILHRPTSADRDDEERLTQTYLEQVNANRDFREVAQFFSSVSYLHLVPQLVRDPDRSVGHKDDPFGGDLLERIAATPTKTRRARLKRIGEALRSAVPQLAGLDLVSDPGGRWHLEGRYEHWRPTAARHNEMQLSDGTLRLFGLLWSLLDGQGPLLLEEPELSLHNGVVRLIPRLMSRAQRGRFPRQVIVSTHSTDLLSDVGVGLGEVLMLVPDREGTDVMLASRDEQLRDLVEGGLPVGEAVMPRTKPANVDQLSLFPNG